MERIAHEHWLNPLWAISINLKVNLTMNAQGLQQPILAKSYDTISRSEHRSWLIDLNQSMAFRIYNVMITR